MTNTLHRQGTAEELKEDYVIFATTARGITREGSAPKIQEFMRICLRHDPVNIGSSRQGNILQDDVEIHELIANLGDGAGAGAVFTDLDTLQKVISELIEADLGVSINVSGLLDGVQQCCRSNGTERHSVEQSLGFWGSRDRLPERDILAFNTLCGHGLVSFNLIRKMIEHVKMRRLTPREAAKIMGKCCECAVFNTVRAEHLLEKMLET
ncbi:hypothetical protein E3J20_04060 [Candidatus Bathyarchaeota archaeon]|nr:MAG: hypothetical protein E3J20_04060 [Candidatus Bathyarchaeota archaeon]